MALLGISGSRIDYLVQPAILCLVVLHAAANVLASSGERIRRPISSPDGIDRCPLVWATYISLHDG